MSFINKHKFLLISVTFLIFSIISTLCLVINHALLGAYDLPFHFRRMSELALMIKHLKFSPGYSFNESNGSAVMYLYPYISMIPLAILSLLIKSKIVLMYIYFSINVLLSLFVCFYSSLKFSKSIKISYLFSIVYSLSTVFLSYSFVSMDIGLELSYVFLPLVFFGLLDIINGYNDYLKLTIGMILLIYSHVLSTVIAVIFLMLLFIININKITKNSFSNIIKSIILSALSTSIVWVNMTIFLYYNYSNIHMPTLTKLIGVNTIEFIKGSLCGVNTFGIGFIPAITVLLSLFFYNKLTQFEKQLYIISICIIVLCSKLFPWQMMPNIISNLLKYFQFTYRFFIIPILFLSYVFSVIVVKLIKVHFVVIWSILLSLLLQFGGQFNLIHKINNVPPLSLITLNNSRFNESYKINKNSEIYKIYKWNFIEYGDYYPKKSMAVKSYVNDNKINKSNKIKLHAIGYNKFYFINNRRINKLSLPLLYYTKERIKLNVDNHNHKFYINHNNLISLNNVKPGKHVMIINNFRTVNIQNDIINIVSLTGILIIIFKILLLYKYKKS